MKIKPEDLKDGIFMYCGNDDDGLRDFVSLAVKDGGIEFKYNNDSGMYLDKLYFNLRKILEIINY